MEEMTLQERNHDVVKILTWFLIGITTLLLIKNFFTMHELANIVTLKGITKKFNPSVHLNFMPYIINNMAEIIICIVVYISATFVLKFKNVWRRILLFSLIIAIMFLVISPLVTYFNPFLIEPDHLTETQKLFVSKMTEHILITSYLWSVIFSIFMVYVIFKLSKREIRALFS